MGFVARNGRVWSMPYGAEYLGEDSAGIPLYFSGTAVCEAKPITPRQIGRS